jgi:hypothetical protein
MLGNVRREGLCEYTIVRARCPLTKMVNSRDGCRTQSRRGEMGGSAQPEFLHTAAQRTRM